MAPRVERLAARLGARYPRVRRALVSVLGRCAAGLGRGIDGASDLKFVLNFYRGYLAFSPREDDIYVVSYPRSGTTWVQFILYQLSSDGEMSFDHLSEVSPWFERSLARGILEAADFEQFSSPRILKSHLLPGWLPRRGRFVYVARDGADVAESYYRFYCSHLGFDGTFDAFFERFLAGDLQYGAWARHVAEWRGRAGDPGVLIVTYEQLTGALEETVRRIAAFCGLPADEIRMGRVLDRCRFEYMKRFEAKFDHITAVLAERGYRLGSFIREGRRGGGSGRLSACQAARLEERSRAADHRAPGPSELARFLH